MITIPQFRLNKRLVQYTIISEFLYINVLIILNVALALVHCASDFNIF